MSGNVMLSLARAVVLDEPINLGPDVIELARLNKVLLHVLRVTNHDGELRASQEDGLRRITNIVAEVEDALGSIEHAFIKLIKPVTYVPADVDVLVKSSQVPLATSRLMVLGYRVIVHEPYTITLIKNGINVDLYTHPSAANLVYIRGEELLNSRVEANFNGVRVTGINEDYEVALTVLHAVYKEGIVTLNDSAMVFKWLNDDSLKLCARLKCIHALGLTLTTMLLSIEGQLRLPYKLPIGYWAVKLLSRVIGNTQYTPSILQGIRRINDPRFMIQLVNRITRISY